MFIAWLALAIPSAVHADQWPNSFLARVEATALLSELNADLLSHSSATATLERWCGAHGLAREAKLLAHLVRGADQTIADDDRQRFNIPADQSIRYRRVQLFCGDRMLSEADNWYVPSRLTPEMNRLLDETDTPFGRAVRELDFQRQTLKSTALWQPLPAGWELQSAQPDASGDIVIPEHVLEHRALLFTRDRVPFSLVVETYTSHMFDFPLKAAERN
jgi:chorismate-pyruvate lyase